MNLTSTDDKPSVGFFLIGSATYVAINVSITYGFLDFFTATIPLITLSFVTGQLTSAVVLYMIRDKVRTFERFVLSIWRISTRTKSSSWEAVSTWVDKSRSDGEKDPVVLSVTPDNRTGEVEIEILSSQGFGFIYGDISDISADPDDAEFARKNKRSTQFATCYMCRNTDSNYTTGFHYKSRSNCSHQHAICEGCIEDILGQIQPTLEKYTTTEELVAKNI